MRRARTSVWLAGALVLLLGGCDVTATDKTPGRIKDGTAELELTVTGRPTPGSLATAEHVLARLKARDADGLAELARDDGGTKVDAERWIARWGDAAQRPAAADFHLGEREASVDVRFTGERTMLSLQLTPKHEDTPYDDTFTLLLRKDR